MAINYSNFKNFNHTFKDIKEFKGAELLYCKICGVKVWIGEEEFWRFVNNKWEHLSISCEEMQIKKLLE